jgi:oligopeptide transport system substrate-binding protein
VIGLLFTGLVGYDPADSAPRDAVAASITSKDATTFRITLRPGWTFHDGTPVTARSFVDAWNHTAYAPNGQANAGWFEKVLGYAQVHPQSGPPTAERMRGLRVLDELLFEVTLTAPFAVFPTLLGAPAFLPLPAVYFTDRARYLRQPIGNGPYRFVRAEADELRLAAHPQYRGAPRPVPRELRLISYPDREDAYRALLEGELDFLDALPHEVVADGSCLRDLDGRLTGRPALKMFSLAVPGYLPGYDDPDLRKAVSLAIDRRGVIDRMLGGRHLPADGWAVPELPDRAPGQAGPYCTFDPRAAREHLARSGFTGPLEFHSPASARGWLGELTRGVSEVLGLECSLVLYDRVHDFEDAVAERRVGGLFRGDWAADYPSLENFLRPQFHSTGPGNDTGYHRPEFDALLAEADAAPSPKAAAALYQKAERLLADDLPHIPLWQEWALAGYSERLTNVMMTCQGELDLCTVVLADGAETASTTRP